MNGNKALNLPHLIYDFAIYEIHRGWLHPAPTSFCLVTKKSHQLIFTAAKFPCAIRRDACFFRIFAKTLNHGIPKMKKHAIIYLLTILTATLCCCEKPAYDGKEDKTESKKDDSGKDDGDNGGWANDPNNNGDGTDWRYSDTLTVKEFCEAETDKAVWVKGVIIGCATGTGGYSYQTEQPFEYNTALLLADPSAGNDVMAVQLQSGSRIRKELNLVDHPENYGKTLVIYGTRTTYLKLPGIKTIFAYDIN